MGDLGEDTSLTARRIATMSIGLYAAPSYLQRRGMPPEPEALMEHDALRLLQRNGDPSPWVLLRGDARWEGIPPGRATANSPELLGRLARAGAGIAAIHDHFAMPYVRSGELLPVLDDWTLPPPDAGTHASVPRGPGGGVLRTRVPAGEGRGDRGEGGAPHRGAQGRLSRLQYTSPIASRTSRIVSRATVRARSVPTSTIQCTCFGLLR
jgi:DNA-binding transcriptional LysR family regulator